jgi:uncharacterized iron-regulated membrane protein
MARPSAESAANALCAAIGEIIASSNPAQQRDLKEHMKPSPMVSYYPPASTPAPQFRGRDMAGFPGQTWSRPLRRAIFQLHLWLGLAVGIYLTVVCVTGALLVFRSDLQRAAFPELLRADTRGQVVDIEEVLNSIAVAYPGLRITGAEAPTQYRQTYLVYVSDAGRFRTILADPGTGRVLGELPTRSWVTQLQALHFNLLLGSTGKILNQIAAVALVVLLFSGATIWWQGRRRWRRGLRIRQGPWPDLLRNLHSAVGAWGWLAALMISITACSLMFPRHYRALMGSIDRSPPTANPATRSSSGDALAPGKLIQLARALHPTEHVSRVVLPVGTGAPCQVSFSAIRPTPLSPSAQATHYFDCRSGVPEDAPASSRANRFIAWTTALHVGNFGGNLTRGAWAVIGFVPPLLFGTGFMLWWRRVVRPRKKKSRS